MIYTQNIFFVIISEIYQQFPSGKNVHNYWFKRWILMSKLFSFFHLHADHVYPQTVRFTLTFASIRKQKLTALSTGADVSGV